MGTTSEELKKLYAKLGGKDPKVAGFSAPGEILNAINEIPLPTEYELPTVTTEDAGDVLVVNDEGKWDKGEAGGGLPEVTTDDNGDILQVVNGAWAKAEPGVGIAVYTGQTETSGNYITVTLDNNKKNRDIYNDVSSGKIVFIKTGGAIYSCVLAGNFIRFSNSYAISGTEVRVGSVSFNTSTGLDGNTLGGYNVSLTTQV